MTTIRSYSLFWIVLLGLLTALGPLSIDMYLPALPNIASSLSVTTALASNSVPAYFAGLAIGQLFYGPLSDRVGRKLPLYLGLSVFTLAGLLCAASQQVEMLIVARVLQALGGCVGVVMARAAIRDRLGPTESSQAYSLLMLVMGVAPILAPLLGSTVLPWIGWRGIFVLLALSGIISLALVHLYFEETLAIESRQQLSARQIVATYWSLLKDRRFRTPALASGALMAVMYCYINAASALFIDHFGVSAHQFSLIFGMNAVGLIVLSQLNLRLVRRVGVLPMLSLGASMQMIGVILLLCFVFTGTATLHATMLALFVLVSGIGFTSPNATALTLAEQGRRAGMASALLGALQFGFGLLAGTLLYVLPFEPLKSMTTVMLCLVGFGLFAVRVLHWRASRSVLTS